jgi:hypothetical protein
MLVKCQDNVWRDRGSVAYSTLGGEVSLEPISESVQEVELKTHRSHGHHNHLAKRAALRQARKDKYRVHR